MLIEIYSERTKKQANQFLRTYATRAGNRKFENKPWQQYIGKRICALISHTPDIRCLGGE